MRCAMLGRTRGQEEQQGEEGCLRGALGHRIQDRRSPRKAVPHERPASCPVCPDPSLCSSARLPPPPAPSPPLAIWRMHRSASTDAAASHTDADVTIAPTEHC